MKTVVILGTGGTISGTGKAGKTTNYNAGEIQVDALCEGVPGIRELAHLEYVQVCNVASSALDDAIWISMAKTINRLAQREEVAGFVITHGTDTIDETAFFLHLTVKTDKPVVITGAMRPASAISADGPLNLYQAVALAAAPEAVGKGVLVLFSDAILSARDVQKVSTFRVDAFSGRDLGMLGYMQDEHPYFYHSPCRPHTVESEFTVEDLERLPKVSVAYFYAGVEEDILDFMAQRYDGLVLAAVGAGSLGLKWPEKLKELSERQFPVVRCSRVANGLVSYREKYDYLPYVLAGYSLPPQKARILLALALTKTGDPQVIQRMFRQY